MLNVMDKRDIKTLGYVMRRTNYGEADRILNIITPNGKVSAIAKGARREKSKLAGGIEMFSLADYNIHFGKGNLGIITSAKMRRYYSKITTCLERMELAADILKKVNTVLEGSEGSDCFEIVDQSFKSIDDNVDLRLIEMWYLLKMKKIIGEEVNFYRDVSGKKLTQERAYDWDMREMAFFENMTGEYKTDDIKLLRLISSNDLDLVRRIKVDEEGILRSLRLVRMVV